MSEEQQQFDMGLLESSSSSDSSDSVDSDKRDPTKPTIFKKGPINLSKKEATAKIQHHPKKPLIPDIFQKNKKLLDVSEECFQSIEPNEEEQIKTDPSIKSPNPKMEDLRSEKKSESSNLEDKVKKKQKKLIIEPIIEEEKKNTKISRFKSKPHMKICLSTFPDMPKNIKEILEQKDLCEESWEFFWEINDNLKNKFDLLNKFQLIGLFDDFTQIMQKYKKKIKDPKKIQEIEEISQKYKVCLKTENDGNSFYRVVGLKLIMDCLLNLKTIHQIQENYIYKLLSWLDNVELINCGGNCHLDLILIKLFTKQQFLKQILKKFFCLFIHQNYFFQSEIKDSFQQKQKLMKFFMDIINEYPILDIALIILMRTYLSDVPQDMKKKFIKKFKPEIFAIEPPFNSLDQLCLLNKIKMTLIDLDSADEQIVKNFYDNDKYMKITLLYHNEYFRLVYTEDEANKFFDYCINNDN